MSGEFIGGEISSRLRKTSNSDTPRTEAWRTSGGLSHIFVARSGNVSFCFVLTCSGSVPEDCRGSIGPEGQRYISVLCTPTII